jgi:hypothetical protein
VPAVLLAVVLTFKGHQLPGRVAATDQKVGGSSPSERAERRCRSRGC